MKAIEKSLTLKAREISRLAALLLAITLCACGGESSQPCNSMSCFPVPIGATVTGLASGQQIVLEDNRGESLTVTANGTFTFPTSLSGHATYMVTVIKQPSGQYCVAFNPGVAEVVDDQPVQISCSYGYVYATNLTSGTISQYAIGADGSLSALPEGTVAAQNPYSIAAEPTGHYVYAALASGIAQFFILGDGSLGALAPAVMSAGNDPRFVVVDPSGKYVYVANWGSNNISQFTIGGDGSLSPIASAATVAAGEEPKFIAVDASDEYVYVVNQGSADISQYTINSDGSLIPMVPATVAALNPLSIAIDPSTSYAYVGSKSNVSQYAIGPSGALSPLTSAIVTSGGVSYSLLVDPTGNYVYVTNEYTGDLTQYGVGISGALTPLAPATVNDGGGQSEPYSIALDPFGKYAYVTNWSLNDIGQYALESGGTLMALATATVLAGTNPNSVTSAR
jgi:6-phosphogluconolactonase